MTIAGLTLRAFTITAALAAAAGATLMLARPQPIESAVLGPDWACTQTAFVLTTCAQHALPALETSRKDAIQATRG